MEHKHLLINATFKQTPFTNVDFTNKWLLDIVELIGMELLYEPTSVRCEQEGNKGISGFCLITTSHICLHSWEEREPNLLQLDIYSCKNFDRNLIRAEIEKFKPLSLGFKFLDRKIKNTKGWAVFDESKA